MPSADQSRQLAKLDEEVKAAQRALDEKTDAIKAQQAGWEQQLSSDFQAGRLKWQYQRPFAAVSAHGARLTIYNDEPVDSNIYVTTGGPRSSFTVDRGMDWWWRAARILTTKLTPSVSGRALEPGRRSASM